jgi:ADP-heptose:LPS heptosyltransferase
VPDRRYRYSKLRWRLLVRALDAAGFAALWFWRKFRPIRRVGTPRRILLIQLDHLGDAILTSPILPRLRAAFPSARLDVLASPSNRALFEADPNVDRVHLAERNWFERRSGGWSMISAVWGLGRRLRRERYDLGIDVRGDVLTVFVLALAGIPRRLGWAMGGGGFLLTDVAEWVPGRHEVDSRLALVDCLGVRQEDPARVMVHLRDEDRRRVAQILGAAWPERPARRALNRVTVGASVRALHPATTARLRDDAESLHAGRFGETAPLLAVHLGAGTTAKRWPLRSWQDLLDRFLDDGWRVVVVGGEEDVASAQSLRPHDRLLDLTGTLAVTQTTALLERADLFLGADSGPAHLAAAAGVTSVVLFSGTNRPRQWRPYSRRTLVLRRSVPCRPCHRKVCPLADHPCLNGLTPDRVYRSSRRWWARLHRAEAPHAPLG